MNRYIGDLGDTQEIKTKAEWLEWFSINGNHDADGWSNGEYWVADMLKSGLIRKE